MSVNGQEMKVYRYERKVGITPTPEFAKKGLATHALNVGLKCSHGCRYCSSPSLLRTHSVFKELGRTAFEDGYCIVDSNTPERIRRQAGKLSAYDTVMLSTLTDPWAPEAEAYDLGRRCLAVLLKGSPCRVRVLTKNAAVRKTFDLMARHPGRVTVGLSMSAPRDRAQVVQIIEPSASPISERLDALIEAHEMGISTYGMLCPCLPGLADAPETIEAMFAAVLAAGAEDIWVEPVNPRGPGLKRCEEALSEAGLHDEAAAFRRIRCADGWNAYAVRVARAAQRVAECCGVLDRLHVLLYEKQFDREAAEGLRKDGRGLVWLGKG